MNQQSQNNAYIEVVYNGKKVPLSYDQVIELSQKGMNYDKLYEKSLKMGEELEGLKAVNQKFENIAKGLDISLDQLLSGLDDERERDGIMKYSKENNIPFEYAKKLKELETQIKALEKEKQELIPIKKKNEDILEFKKLYPNVDERDLDPEIIKEWESSKRPLKDVYNEITLRKLLEEKTAKKANEENSNASTGSALGVPEREEEYTDEMIRNMSSKEFNQNFKKILQQYKKGDR